MYDGIVGRKGWLKVSVAASVLCGIALVVLLLTAPSEYEFVRRLGGSRWEPKNVSPLIQIGAQPTARFVFATDPEQVLKEMRSELAGKGWFDLNEIDSTHTAWWTTFARSDDYKAAGFNRDRSDWINLSPTYNYEDYPDGTTCVVELCIEPSWMHRQIQRFRELIFGHS